MAADSSRDERFMRRALVLASRGIGTSHPNPRVGAVVVAGERILGEGWHRHPGCSHAEVIALDRAGSAARGATLYVTLEPCNGHGRTPPCTQAILQAGIRRVVYASADPNPVMAGGGRFLEERGIEVQRDVMKDRAEKINRPFFHFIRTGMPYVVAKAAISMDGKLATRCRHSQWISGEQSRRHAHRLRAASDAILVGSGTFKHDNPSLTIHGAKRRGEPPLRVVLCLDTPVFSTDYQLLDGNAPSRLYVRSLNRHTPDWEKAGVGVVQVGSLQSALQHLAAEGRLALLLEGGGQLHAAFLEAQLSCELVLYQAPILIGGRAAPGLWHGIGVSDLDSSPSIVNVVRRRLGEDQLIQGTIIYPC